MSWDDVFTSLGLRTLTKETRARVEGHAIRLGLDVEHLLVQSNREILRVQVKTTTARGATGTVSVSRRPYSARNLGPRMPYDAKVIDYFFIVDGDHNIYLIPSRVIAGRVGLGLRTYRKFIVGNAAGLLGASADAGPGTAVVSRSA